VKNREEEALPAGLEIDS